MNPDDKGLNDSHLSSIEFTLVDVFTTTLSIQLVSNWARACVATGFIATNFIGTAIRCSCLTFIDIYSPIQNSMRHKKIEIHSNCLHTDALCSLIIRRKSSGAREQIDAFIRAICVHASLISTARIAHVTLIDIDASALTTSLEAHIAWTEACVPIAVSTWNWWRRRCNRNRVSAIRCSYRVSSRRRCVDMRVNVWPWCGRRSYRGGCWWRCGRSVARSITSEATFGVSALVRCDAIVTIQNAFVIVWSKKGKFILENWNGGFEEMVEKLKGQIREVHLLIFELPLQQDSRFTNHHNVPFRHSMCIRCHNFGVECTYTIQWYCHTVDCPCNRDY